MKSGSILCFFVLGFALALHGAESVLDCSFLNPVFDGNRFEELTATKGNLNEFTLLLTMEADIVKDGTYAWTCRHDDAKGEIQWALYRAGWNNHFGFYINTKPKAIFVHVAPGSFANGMHSVAVTVSQKEIKLYCDGKVLKAQLLEGYTYTDLPGNLTAGALNAKLENPFYGKISQIKLMPGALDAKAVEYAFGTPRRPSIKVFAVPQAPVPQAGKVIAPPTPEDALTGMLAVDWRIAPESTPEELAAIAQMVKRNGFDKLFVGGSFRYLFAEKYGDRNWWAAIPWSTYQETLANLDKACTEADLEFVMHLTCDLGLFPDLEREFAGMTMREIKDSQKEIPWRNYYGLPICPNNEAFRAKYHQRLRDIIAKAPHIAGIMIDEMTFGPGYTACGCDTCKKLFLANYADRMPDPDNPSEWNNFDSKLFRDWLRFRTASVQKNMQAAADVVQSESRFWTSSNYNPSEAHIPVLHGCNQLRYPGKLLFNECEPCHPWNWRFMIAEGKYLQSDGRPLTVQGYSNSISQSYFQLLFCMAQNWGNSQWAEFNSYNLVPVNWFKFWKPLNYQLSSIAKIALVISADDHTVSDYDRKNGNVPKEYFGWAEALTEAHIPFDVIQTQALVKSAKRYPLIIVPGTLCWSDGELDALQAYLAQGGKVIAAPGSFALNHEGDKRTARQWSGNLKQLDKRFGEAYFAPRIGAGWYGNGAAWFDDRDASAKAAMLDLVKEATVLVTTLPEEVIVSVNAQKLAGCQSLVIRLFNLTGTRSAHGYAVPGAQNYEFINYPVLEQEHTISVKTAQPVTSAWMISPDFAGKIRLQTTSAPEGFTQVKVPGLARFAILILNQAGDIVSQLAPELREYSTMPGLQPFDYRYTSVR